jgi:hypothetical protein
MQWIYGALLKSRYLASDLIFILYSRCSCPRIPWIPSHLALLAQVTPARRTMPAFGWALSAVALGLSA